MTMSKIKPAFFAKKHECTVESLTFLLSHDILLTSLIAIVIIEYGCEITKNIPADLIFSKIQQFSGQSKLLHFVHLDRPVGPWNGQCLFHP